MSTTAKLEDTKEMTEAEMTKEMQIIILKEKLQLSERLLTDKDVQLEGYKQLVKTLKDILAEVSRQKNSLEVATVGNNPPVSSNNSRSLHTAISAPPGFQPKPASVVQPLTKEKETGSSRSFHEDSRQIRPTASTPHPQNQGGLQSGKSIPLRRTNSETRQKHRDGGSEPSERPKFGKDGKSRSLPSLAQIGEIAGQVYSLSKTQQGCRLLQTRLEDDPSSIGIIFKELEGHLLELMLDPFGNYLFTKLVESCSTQQKDKICEEILSETITAATDKYGSQCLQKMFSHLNEQQMGLFIGSLKENCSRLIKHEKANYLIQFCLEQVPHSNQWIYDSVCAEMDNVGSDKFGCVIIKKCLDRASDDQRIQLVDAVLQNVMVLVEDQFGNYIVQHILDKYPGPESSAPIIRSLLGHIVDLCTQKYSSNVVERCLRVADVEVQSAILEEITSSGFLAQLINDRFANFVIQTALDVAGPDQRETLVRSLLPHLNGAHTPYSKRLREKILQTQ